MNDITILEGAEGIKQAYKMTLAAKRLDIVCLSSVYASVVGDYFDRDYSPRLFGSIVKTREILPDTTANRADSAKKDGVKNQVHFIDKLGVSESDYMLFGNTAVLVSYNVKHPFAVVIRNHDIVANLATQFAALWRSLK